MSQRAPGESRRSALRRSQSRCTRDRSLRVEKLDERTLLAVASLLPDANSHDAEPATNIQADFTQPIDAGSLNDQTFVVHAMQTGRPLTVNGDITSLSAYGTQVTLEPAADFHAGELVQVTITDGLEASGGGSASGPFVWQFRTATTTSTGQFVDSGQTLGNFDSLGVSLGDLDGDGDRVSLQMGV